MNILIISNIKQSGYGESTRPLFLGLGFKSAGHKVLHVCNRSGTDNRTRFVRYDAEESIDLFSKTLRFINLFLQARLFRPDIIYVHQLNNWNWVRLSRALPSAITVYDAHTSVLLEHSTFGGSEKGLAVTKERELNALVEPDHVITVSNETKAYFTSNFKIDENRISVIKNATNILPVDEVNVKKSSNTGFICCAVLPQDGFLSNKIALDMLLEVASKMELIDPSIVFQVIGGGPKPEPESSNVQYLGFVEDLVGSIMASDLCLVTYPEKAVCGGARNKVCDFLALGKPIVSTTEGMRGLDDCSPDQEYALADSTEEFVHTILYLQKSATKRRLLSENALKKSHDYQWPVRSEEVLATFEKIRQRN